MHWQIVGSKSSTAPVRRMWSNEEQLSKCQKDDSLNTPNFDEGMHVGTLILFLQNFVSFSDNGKSRFKRYFP